MPIQSPPLDNRKYQDLVNQALARIAVHNPEWTNYNDSDPGVTLVQLFAFLTESLLYRVNLVPDRNRRKFLMLLGLGLQPAMPAQGLITFENERGPLQTIPLNANLEVDAGPVPFRTVSALDVLPVETRVVYKRRIANPEPSITAVYEQLYTSYTLDAMQTGSGPPQFAYYETVTLPPPGPALNGPGVRLAAETVDSSLWIALLARTANMTSAAPGTDPRDAVRDAIGGKTISLGFVPLSAGDQEVSPGSSGANADGALFRRLPPGVRASGGSDTPLRFWIPIGGTLDADGQARYRKLDPLMTGDVLQNPGVVQLTLPPKEQLTLWPDLQPLEAGTRNLPPALDDTTLNDRLITWIQVQLAPQTAVAGQDQGGVSQASILWTGINAVSVSQRAHVAAEALPEGTGEPDQTVTLARTPVIAGSVELSVTVNGQTSPWTAIDDLLSAGPEVPVREPRLPPGTCPPRQTIPPQVFTLDPESGTIRFGDGLHGARPPFRATLRAAYDYGVGRAGNVGISAISSGPTLPAGFKVANPVPTWGGADAETVQQGEKQVTRYLQHRDRLVTVEDFQTIAYRTPGVDMGRVEVLPVYNPQLAPNEPGDAPGAVTLLLIPQYDPQQPDAPRPDALFLNTVCAYLDSRRLITTELVLRGPNYQPIWISVGINVSTGASVSAVREAVKAALTTFLSPLPTLNADQRDNPDVLAALPSDSHAATGWPLRTDVVRLQLWAVANRVPGVSLVNDLLLALDTGGPAERVPMIGLDLPRVLGIAVTVGAPLSLDDLRSQTLGTSATGGPGPGLRLLPVPVLPEDCR